MPYTMKTRRKMVDSVTPRHGIADWTAGDVTYCLTRVVWQWLKANGIGFLNCATVIGCLVCTILELYRRVVAPYEDKKIKENGDVYL